MTKRHLRPWVHVAIIILILFGWFYLNYSLSARAVQDCIEKGQDEKICDELWK